MIKSVLGWFVNNPIVCYAILALCAIWIAAWIGWYVIDKHKHPKIRYINTKNW